MSDEATTIDETFGERRQIPGALDVRGKSRNRIAIGDADDGLCRQVKDDFDLILAERTFDEIAVDDIAAHGDDLFNAAAAHKFALRNPVAHQAHHICARFKKLLDQPRAEQSCAASDEDRAIAPK